MNFCTVCGEDFASLGAFDEHRVGVHEHTITEGLAMDPPREDGRRCLHAHELDTAGWHRDRWNRWRLPVALEPHLIERVAL